MAPLTAREAALKALTAYRRDNAWSDKSLAGIIEKSGISVRDAALAYRILGGVLQNMALCDYYIRSFSSVDFRKIEPQVLDILRISIYQLVFLTKIPQNAAVNEGVTLANKHANPRAKGFVNAVLRRVAEAVQHGSLPEGAGNSETARMAVLYSHPEWFTRELIDVLGADGAEALLRANNDAEMPVTAQVNTLLTNTGDVLSMLEAAGISAAGHEWLDNCVLLRGAGNIERVEAFSRGFINIQDAAARLAVIAADVKPGDFVIDGCAAPGGKSFAAAIMMKNEGKILSCDIHEKKLRHIESGARRLGISIITTRALDASKHAEEYVGAADVVIADVPCSGFGVIRKKPEIRYKQEDGLRSLPDAQKRILSNLSTYVKPGGTLIYSTCTVFKQENEEVADWFLSGHKEFYAEGFTLPGIGHIEDGMVTLWPHIHGTDGFFICKLRRSASLNDI